MKHTSIKIILALVAVHNLELEQMDVKTSFLHGNLEETIYMSQPEGYGVKGKKEMVCLLRASVLNFERLDILQDVIGHPSKKLLRFEFPTSFRFQLRASRYITGLNRTSELKLIVV